VAPAVADHRRGAHRIPAPPAALRGRATVAAVAAGAVVAAGQALTAFVFDGGHTDFAKTSAGALVPSGTDPLPRPDAGQGVGGDQATSQLLPFDTVNDVVDVQNLTKAIAVGEQLAKKGPSGATTAAGGAVRPAAGIFTSGFGGRWGVTHYGVDIANAIGTPILAAEDGVVVESGPASGFGMWVRVLHPDGFTTVYGHINRSLVNQGEHVKAGQQIAEMGNRGFSTGPHLHFEVWDAAGNKLNPQPWLAARGVAV
jgi:murein DD-endopeptidase MepM/ murein hydrolase activator NlpD